MESEGYTEPVPSFTALGKLALPLTGRCTKETGLGTQERGLSPLTTGEDEPTLAV